jgi:hypothetical protein
MIITLAELGIRKTDPVWESAAELEKAVISAFCFNVFYHTPFRFPSFRIGNLEA